MKRREERLKLEKQGRISRKRKKYLHESRHLHALSRMRGRGGKFGKRNESSLLPQVPSTTAQWPKFHVPQLVRFQVPQFKVEYSSNKLVQPQRKGLDDSQNQQRAVTCGRKRRPRAAAAKKFTFS
ncbi:unnamed protein product [Enterobius vermicularis]|uniref:Nuclear transcription factor Y subunit n=1 Tax=Enterobius vermicularis TaxID=51028 RepID=A0A0N4UVA9_ENTVE|nr:unnamed protein product [Enterobius vermicularis]